MVVVPAGPLRALQRRARPVIWTLVAALLHRKRRAPLRDPTAIDALLGVGSA